MVIMEMIYKPPFRKFVKKQTRPLQLAAEDEAGVDSADRDVFLRQFIGNRSKVDHTGRADAQPPSPRANDQHHVLFELPGGWDGVTVLVSALVRGNGIWRSVRFGVLVCSSIGTKKRWPASQPSIRIFTRPPRRRL